MRGYQYFEPETVEEAVAVLAEYAPDVRPIAGGTDLMLDVNIRGFPACHLVSLSRIPDINFIKANGGLKIGAATIFHDINKSADVRNQCRMLAEAAGIIGSRQIRNLATVGGNLCNALPCADSVPALVAMDSEVVIAGSSGTRYLPVENLIVGPRRTRLTPDELVSEIHIPPLPDRSGSVYIAKRIRNAMDMSIVGAAIALTLADDFETIVQARIALANCSRSPMRAREAEQLLAGKHPSEELFIEAGHLTSQAVKLRDTALRASLAYRLEMVNVLVRRGLQEAYNRARITNEE